MSTGASVQVDFPVAVPALVIDAPASRPNGGQGPSPSPSPSVAQGLDLWFENFRKYEATLVRIFVCS
jgi:hypothetical protein